MTAEAQAHIDVAIVEGQTVLGTPRVSGAPPDTTAKAVLSGPEGILRLDDVLLSRHLLFLGSIGSGKTNAMMQIAGELRANATPDDVFVVFDTKGDFLRELYRPGDAVLSNEREGMPGGETWNAFADVLAPGRDERGDEIYEIASTIFADELESAGENMFFAAGARDVFAAVMDALDRESQPHNNRTLRSSLESSTESITELISQHDDLAGARHYLAGAGNSARAVMAFLQQSTRAAFSGAFQQPGDFSVREFVRRKGGRALFVEYDMAVGARLLPVYRTLIDLAIKESLARDRSAGNVYMVMDEFSLLPRLSHLADGINFGRSLGIKFLSGTQNVGQVYEAYGQAVGDSILSGFGTLFAFRLMDATSRELVRGRFGTNRKQLTSELAVRAKGLQQDIVLGNVIEDWVLSGLQIGEAIIGLPTGAPFRFPVEEYRARI